MVDVGQPLRAWFTFWHPNTHSMLTEVTFCLTMLSHGARRSNTFPIVLKNRKLRQIPRFLVFEFELHKVMPVFAGIGTFLSFFHQGSLGGSVRRPGGPSVCVPRSPGHLAVHVLSLHPFRRGSGPELRSPDNVAGAETLRKTARETGRPEIPREDLGTLLIVYVLLKAIDTLYWINYTSPHVGRSCLHVLYFAGSFGTWILVQRSSFSGSSRQWSC